MAVHHFGLISTKLLESDNASKTLAVIPRDGGRDQVKTAVRIISNRAVQILEIPKWSMVQNKLGTSALEKILLLLHSET